MTFATILTLATSAGGFGLAPAPSRRPPRLDFSDMRCFHVDDQVAIEILVDDVEVRSAAFSELAAALAS